MRRRSSRPAGRARAATRTASRPSGRLVFVAGPDRLGRDGAFPAADLAGQVRQTLRNVRRRAGRGRRGPRARRAADLVRHRPRRVPRPSPREIGAAYREVMGRHFPAMAVVVVAGLMEADAKVEIEATAVVPD